LTVRVQRWGEFADQLSKGVIMPSRKFVKRKTRVDLSRLLNYVDQEQWADYIDVAKPMNLGRRRPNVEEWDDYILEAQLLWVEHLDTLEIDHERYNKEYKKRKPRIKALKV
jgi:hypothetical protein